MFQEIQATFFVTIDVFLTCIDAGYQRISAKTFAVDKKRIVDAHMQFFKLHAGVFPSDKLSNRKQLCKHRCTVFSTVVRP